MEFSYKFSAVKGNQANSDFFICMMPLKLLGKLFIDVDYEVAPEYRAQRKINELRIPEIKRYILDNRNSYVFSALAASIDGEIEFKEFSKNLGILEISMDSRILINDGQHRKAAILAALEDDESLKDETIPVVLFIDKGLSRSQQMFTDLNKHAVNTSKSLNALYDWKDRNSLLTKKLVNEINFFKKYTDKEKDILGKFSSMLFTLNNIVNANIRIIKCNEDDDIIYNYMKEYWSLVVENINEWNELEERQITKKDLRENYIITQGVTILALGYLGEFFYYHKEFDMKKYLVGLKKINWLRSNERDWLGSAIKFNGKINRTNAGINLTYLQIKKMLGIELTKKENHLLIENKKGK